MFTILGADGKEYGPVTAGKLHEWIAAGRANLQTKVRRYDETEWKTLGDFPEFSQFGTTGSGVPPALPTQAAGSAADAVQAPLTGSAKEIADDLIARATPLDVFGCLGQSFSLWTANFLPLVGVTLLIFVIQMVANVMLGLVPFLGFLLSAALSGIIYGGLYYYYLGKLRGGASDISDAFAGFTRTPGPLALATILTSLLTIALLAVFYAPMFGVILQVLMHRGAPLTSMPALPALGGLAFLSMGLGFLVLLYICVAWVFTLILVIDKGLSPWTAMEVSRRVVTRQWFRVFFVMLLGVIMTMLGLIGIILGVFLTLPLMIGAIICAYEHLCSPPPRSG